MLVNISTLETGICALTYEIINMFPSDELSS